MRRDIRSNPRANLVTQMFQSVQHLCGCVFKMSKTNFYRLIW